MDKTTSIDKAEQEVQASKDDCITVPPMEDKTKEKVFQLRDVVWARVTGYPWWPGYITVEKSSGQYTMDQSTKGRHITKYHVRFFGPANERAWLAATSIASFQGKESFPPLNNSGSKKSKKKQSFAIPKNQQVKWEIAVDEADVALLEGPPPELVPVTKNPPPAKTPVAAKKPLTERNGKEKANGKKSVSSDDDEQSEEEGSQEDDFEPPAKRKKNNKGQKSTSSTYKLPPFDEKKAFREFMDREFDDLKEESPDLSDEYIRKLLTKKWNGMTKEERKSYLLQK